MQQSSVDITCKTSQLSFIIFEVVDHVYIFNLKFLGYTLENEIQFVEIDPTTQSILIKASLTLLGCIVENNDEIIVISAMYSNITAVQATFRDNRVISIFSYSHCDSKIVNSTFVSNRGLLVTSAIIHGMPFNVGILSNTWIFNGCEFRNNYNGLGAIVVLQYSDVSIIDTRFTSNRGMQSLAIYIKLCH